MTQEIKLQASWCIKNNPDQIPENFKTYSHMLIIDIVFLFTYTFYSEVLFIKQLRHSFKYWKASEKRVIYTYFVYNYCI